MRANSRSYTKQAFALQQTFRLLGTTLVNCWRGVQARRWLPRSSSSQPPADEYTASGNFRQAEFFDPRFRATDRGPEARRRCRALAMSAPARPRRRRPRRALCRAGAGARRRRDSLRLFSDALDPPSSPVCGERVGSAARARDSVSRSTAPAPAPPSILSNQSRRQGRQIRQNRPNRPTRQANRQAITARPVAAIRASARSAPPPGRAPA